MSKSITQVAGNALEQFADAIYPKAVRIVTPFPEQVPLSRCGVDDGLRQIIKRYEPEVIKGGLYRHQANFLESFAANKTGDFIMTTATGSGKSLCFWVWVFECLQKDPSATALLCFPTQALMWSQAERMCRLSNENSLRFPGTSKTAYGGELDIGQQRIGWTIWQGVGSGPTKNRNMDEQERSDAFAAARIRIATLDKAHWSLFSNAANKEFASRLRCLVLDEAHSYDGVFGANVHYFFKRVYIGSQLNRRDRPNIFLASATLSAGREFAANLISLAPADIIHIEDSTKQLVDLVRAMEISGLLKAPPLDGLSRFVLLLDDPANTACVEDFLCEGDSLGKVVNAIYFSQSKYQSKRLAMRLDKVQNGRPIVIYDGDLPPEERREIEKRLNNRTTHGVTVLGTSALELGIDIAGLDVCLMGETPPRRSDLLQRIGRVGRRLGCPGLVVLRLSPEPHDRDMLEDPVTAFQLDRTRLLPIPLHLESLKWRSILAAFTDWEAALRSRTVSWDSFNQAIRQHFGVDPAPNRTDLKEQFRERYGQLVDMTEKFWVYKGFRATASTAKVPLRNGNDEIAWIDDIAIFRDAHPGAVYLGHDRKSYRVIDYKGNFKIAEWRHPDSDTVLGKWLKTVQWISVQPEHKRITTRGAWEDRYALWEVAHGAEHLQGPRHGSCKFGIWNYERRWAGYTEIDLDSGRSRKVTLQEATKFFSEAMHAGHAYPFLFPLSYRTLGWQWDFGRVDFGSGDPATLGTLSTLVGGLLEHFLAAVVESRLEDLSVEFDAGTHQLRVLDSAPGGNGLSEALLVQDRMLQAMEKLGRMLKQHAGKDTMKIKGFKKYLLALHLEPSEHSAQELFDVVRKLQMRWTG